MYSTVYHFEILTLNSQWKKRYILANSYAEAEKILKQIIAPSKYRFLNQEPYSAEFRAAQYKMQYKRK
jgi:hypothetical protein